jgi:type I restriction enzyme, S subunit
MNSKWEIKKLSEVCDEIFAGVDVPKDNCSKALSNEFNIPIFTNGEKNKGLYGFTNTARVTKPAITISARGTIGYSEIRIEPFFPAIGLIVVIPNTDILDLSFLKYSISRIAFASSGASIPQLTVPMIKEYTVPIPPIDIQRAIVNKLDIVNDELTELESIYSRKMENVSELRKSIINKAFLGELKID